MKDFITITTELRERGIDFEEVHFSDVVISARISDTSKDHNFNPQNAIKTLLIKTSKGINGVVLKGDDKIDQVKLKAIVGKWSVVDKLTVENELKMVVGGICPLVLDFHILIDKNVLKLDILSMGAGDVSKGLNVKADVFKNSLADFEIVDIKNPNTILQKEDNEKLNLIKQNLNEIIGEEDLIKLIENGTPLNHYIGFEISGLVHLGTGLSSMLKIRDLQKAGVHCRVFLADWHTWINDKLGGDHVLIKRVAKEYFQPALEICAEIVGADPTKIEFIQGSDLYHNNDKFWQSVVEISKNLTLSRVLKSTSIMGRDERDSQPFAWLVYPPMQCADIFTMGVNIAHAGTDQRKIHVITREVALKLKVQNLIDINNNVIKPVAIHHDLLLGLQSPKVWPLPIGEEKDSVRTQMKMSKSVPGSAIFIHDSEDEIRDKIKKAFCPEKEIEFNPVINWVKHLIMPLKEHIKISKEARFGGDIEINDFVELEQVFQSGGLHPMDLKNAVADILVDILKPARERFNNSDSQQLIDLIRSIDKKR